MKHNDQPYLQQCLHLIEQKTGWGSHVHWTNQDFIRLGDMIMEETGIHLSATTLKRVWGKVAYNSFPHITTLNTLANYAGYACWRSFVTAHHEVTARQSVHALQHTLQEPAATNTQSAIAQEYKRDRRHVARAAALVLLLIVGFFALLGAILSTYTTTSKASETYTFSANPVTTGVPNTVIFNYDTSAKDAGNLYIQSSDKHKHLVAADKHQHTALYYYPGVYQTKLLAGEQVVKTQEVLVKTNGWQAMIERDPAPLYVKENVVEQGAFGIPAATLASLYPDMQVATPWVAYYNVGNFAPLQSNNFILETALKSTFDQGEAVCQDTSIVILRTQAPPITIPLAIPGCIARVDEALKQSPMQHGKTNLTAFGCDFSDWVQVKCEAKGQQFRLWINQQLAYEGTLQHANSQIAGIAYRFHGTGSVNYLHIGTASGEMIYKEDFVG